MKASFLFYFDPALTTPVRGAVMLTVSSGEPSKDLTLYFGSPIASRYCVAENSGPIIVAAQGDGSDGVSLSLVDGTYTSGQSVDCGERIQGGVSNRIPIYFRVQPGHTSLSVTCSALAEYAP